MSRAERDAEFADFARQAHGSLLRTAWLLTGSSDAAAELVQAALVKTYVAWPKVRPGGALAYARRILANHRVDAWRATRREVVTDVVPEHGAVSSSVAAADDRDEIHRWLAGLPDQQRRVVVLRFYSDLSERDTAEALGISVGAVKSASSRGLAALREIAARDRAADLARSSGLRQATPPDPRAGDHRPHPSSDSTPAAQPSEFEPAVPASASTPDTEGPRR